MAWLIVATENGGRSIELGEVSSIGRHPNNAVQLLDKTVSKEHCVIENRAGSWVLRDLGALAGTHVNGERVRGEIVLSPGDEIALGATRARFDMAPPLPRLGDRGVPLVGVAVIADVVGGRADVRVEQRYRNTEARPIEAVYTFPIPSDATVVGFAMLCNERRIDAEVRERQEAFRAYDDALAAGHGSALLERERRDIFTCNVGNILPGEEVTVGIEYVQRLVADEGTVRMTVPTLVAPRYVPGTPKGDRPAHGVASPTDLVPDADRVSPPAGDVDYRATLDLTVRLGGDVGVRSMSHPIATRASGDTMRVSFGGDAVALDRDIVLAFETAAPVTKPVLAQHRKAGERGYFAATFVPDLFEAGQVAGPLSVVFVLDRSGSMGGASIVEARRALHLCLRNLREGDRFNVIAFDNLEERFAPELVPLTQTTMDDADRWIDAIEARGGTEMLHPMLHAAEMANDGILVVLTDGQVANEAQIEGVVMDHRGRARIYGFAIGTNVSDALLASLAKRTNGAIERVHPGERLDDKVVAVFARAVAERVTDVKPSVRGVEVDELAPASLPDLVDGEPWSIFGRFDGAGPAALELRGKKRGEPFFVEVPLDFTSDSNDPIVARFWAAERVRDLESANLEGRRAEANRTRIVKLAIEHRIASSVTSFVAVEKRKGERVVQGIAETRVVPVHAPSGWRSPTRARAPMQAPPRAYAAAQSPQGKGRLVSSADDEPIRTLARSVPVHAASPEPPPIAASPAAPLAPTKSGLGGPTSASADPVAETFARQLMTGLWRATEKDSPHGELFAALRALSEVLSRGLTRESPELARYGKQLAKAAEAVLALVRDDEAIDSSLASSLVAALLILVPSARTQRSLEEAAQSERSLAAVKGALGDIARLRVLASS